MAQSTLINRAQMTVTGNPGTGTVTLNAAVAGYQTFATAGIADGALVSYVIQQGTIWEYGQGTYTASGTTLARTNILGSSSGGAAVSFNSTALVYCDANAADLPIGNLCSAAKEIVAASDVSAVFIDDVSKWSDSGARDKMASSIITETLNTATRGATAKYPMRALWVGRPGSATVYDLTDPACPMWAVFNYGAGLLANEKLLFPNSSCGFAINGMVYIGGNGGWSEGLLAIDLIGDGARLYDGSNGNLVWSGNLAQRNVAGLWVSAPSTNISSGIINDIAATILPLTPPNPLRCNLPNPTIEAFTAGGISTIRADGYVVNSNEPNSFTSGCFDFAKNLWSINATYGYLQLTNSYVTTSFLSRGSANIYWTAAQIGVGTLKSVRPIPGGVSVAGSMGVATIKLDATNPSNSLISVTTPSYATGWQAGAGGAIRAAFAESSADLSSLVATAPLNDTFASDPGGWTTSSATYAVSGGAANVGWSSGGYVYKSMTTVIGKTYVCKVVASAASATCYIGAASAAGSLNLGSVAVTGAGTFYFSFTAIGTTTYFDLNGGAGQTASFTALSCVLAASDRSVAGNNAVVNGTITRSAVASGADLAAYGGFSSSNYLRVPYNSGFDFGTGDLCVMGWLNFSTGAGGTQYFYDRGYYTGGAYSGSRFTTYVSGSTLTFAISGYNAVSTAIPVGVPFFIATTVRSGYMELWLNGVKVASVTTSGANLTNTNAVLNFGCDINPTASPLTYSTIVLPRVTAFAPTPDQIAAVYAAELPLFQPNAKCLLTGANVQALAYDPDTQQLAASNSTAGTDTFNGLVRVANQNSASPLSGSTNHKAVSFIGGDMAIGTAAGVDGTLALAPYLRETAKGQGRPKNAFYDPTRGRVTSVTTSATPVSVYFATLVEGKGYQFKMRIGAVQYGGAFTNYGVFEIVGQVYRPIGGVATVQAATPTVIERSSGSMAVSISADTTNQAIYAAVTGLSSTTFQWTVDVLEWVDSGLDTAA